MKAEGFDADNADTSLLTLLDKPQERELIRQLAALPGEVDAAAKNYDPAKITKYSVELATLFHKFYDACSVKNAESDDIKKARLLLCKAVRQALKNTLSMMKITYPEKM